MPANAKEIKLSFEQARTQRSNWDSNFQDLRELVRCDVKDFNRSVTPGNRRYDNVYDGTAIDAAEEAASGIHAYLTSPTERWFELSIAGIKKEDLKRDDAAIQWLEVVADIIYDVFSDSRVNFNTAIAEVYADLMAFGTGCTTIEWDDKEQHIVFKTDTLSEFFFAEDSNGRINRLWQYFELTGQQIMDTYSDEPGFSGSQIWKEAANPKNVHQKYKIIRAIFPRKDRKFGAKDAKNMPFASVTITEKTVEVLRESGYTSFPTPVSRWTKIAGEVYGRSPAMKCMPDIMALQTIERTLLKAGQKAVDPPIVFDDDGFLEPISTAPGAIMYKEPGTEMPQALDFKGNLQFGVEQANQKREYIRKCFYTELFTRFRKNREQSAHEVMDDRDEMLRKLAPMLGRQQNELLGPVIERVYDILSNRGFIPPAPPSLQKQRLIISYISPAARAQQGVIADRVSRFMQDIIPVAQIDPTTLDAVKGDELVRIYANARGVPRVVIRSLQELEDKRNERAQQEQLAQMAQAAEPASKALLNVAQAAQASGGGLPGGPV